MVPHLTLQHGICGRSPTEAISRRVNDLSHPFLFALVALVFLVTHTLVALVNLVILVIALVALVALRLVGK